MEAAVTNKTLQIGKPNMNLVRENDESYYRMGLLTEIIINGFDAVTNVVDPIYLEQIEIWRGMDKDELKEEIQSLKGSLKHRVLD